MRTAVFTVTYPAAAPYWQDFIRSLRQQSDQGFHLLIVNDGALSIDALGVGCGLQSREESGSAARLRKIGIEWAREEGFDILIFADADDWFGPERVAAAKRGLLQQDILVNDLLLFGKRIDFPFSLLTSRFDEGRQFVANDLMHSNFMGLSNSSARISSIVPTAKRIPDNQIAFDWALFTECMNKGAKASFLAQNAAATHYRQHGSNIAGLSNYDDDNIVRGIKIKVQQYRFLSESAPWYRQAAIDFGKLCERVQNDPVFREHYCERIRRSSGSKYFLWWEHIRLESDL